MHTPHVPFFYATNTFYFAILYTFISVYLLVEKKGIDLIERKICRH